MFQSIAKIAIHVFKIILIADSGTIGRVDNNNTLFHRRNDSSNGLCFKIDHILHSGHSRILFGSSYRLTINIITIKAKVELLLFFTNSFINYLLPSFSIIIEPSLEPKSFTM